MKIKIEFIKEDDLNLEDLEFEERRKKIKTKKIKENPITRDIYRKNKDKNAQTSIIDSESE